MKRQYIVWGIFCGFLCLPHFSRTMDLDNDVRLVDTFDEAEETMLGNTSPDEISFPMPTRAIIPPDQIDKLIDQIGGFGLIEEVFYKRTNPFVQRSLLDLPLWELHSCQEPERWIIGGQLFWNKTDRSVFTCKSTNIESYLNLEQKTIFAALDNLSPLIKDLFPESSLVDQLSDTSKFQQTLLLFRGFTVEQRRLGVMLHAWRQWQRAEMRMLLPFYYLQRNLFASPDDQQAIEREFGAATPEESQVFLDNHAISDRVGFGDFRFEANYAVYLSDTFALRVGGFLTLPTAFAVSKGIKGTTFDTDLCQPTLDLQALFDLAFADGDATDTTVSANEQELFKEFLIGDICKNKNGFLIDAVDRLNAILLDAPLGNGQHVGLGLIMRSKTSLRSLLDEYEWTDQINWNNRLSIEFFTPANETRFFAKRITAADFEARDFTSDDEQVQADNLKFIGKEIVDKFFPYAIKTRVQPGAILRWFSRWCFTGDVWDFSLGSDIWIQRGEKFKKLYCVDPDLRKKLDICDAHNSLAYQFKSVASFGFKFVRPDYSFFVTINAEGTSWNKGIGDDWGVSLNLEANF